MQIAVGSHKRAGVRRAAGTRGRAPRAVVFEFVVSKAAVAGVVGPERGIRLRRSAAVVSEFIAPRQRARRNVQRERLAPNRTRGKHTGVTGNGYRIDGEARNPHARRLVLSRG